MRVILELFRIELGLTSQEALALTGAKEHKRVGNLLFLDISEEKLKECKERLAFTHHIYEVLFTCPHDELIKRMEEYDWKSVYQTNFFIRIKDHAVSKPVWLESGTEQMERDLAKIVWHKVENPKVSFKDTKTPIFLFATEDETAVAIRRASPEKDFQERRPHLRVFTHSSSMHPRLARALVNATGAQRGNKILDPCCGAGGFIIEMAMMGLDPQGYDINRKMVWGCMRNMAQRRLTNYKAAVKDLFTINEKWDYVVTDLPYGLNSNAMKSEEEMVNLKSDKERGIEELERFYLKFFKKLQEICTKRAVIMMPHYVNYRQIITEAGLPITHEYSIYVHKSLTRKIVIIDRKE